MTNDRLPQDLGLEQHIAERQELVALRQLRDDLIQAYDNSLAGERALHDGIIPLVNRAHELSQP